MKKTYAHIAIALGAATALTAPAFAQAPAAVVRQYSPVTSDMLLNPPPNEWLMWRRTLDNQGYSPLARIDKSNVAKLEYAWSFPMPKLGQQEVAPLVHDGIMFLASNENVVTAVDAVTGDLIWEYKHIRPDFGAKAAYHNNQAMRQKNSVALYKDQVILTTVDARLMALNGRSGEIVWDKQVNDWSKGYSYTAGPVVANGKIFTGTSGCSISGTNGACYITAHNADTGAELWRFNTLVDGSNPAVDESWRGLPAENRWGGSPWASAAYDPQLNLVYYGTGMPIPYPEIIRGSKDGDTLYTNSTLALDADSGKLKWYFQHMPRDNWDLDSPFERVLIDADVGGAARKLLVTVPGKNSIAFGLDRATGQFLWHKETVFQNVVKSIDPKTGKVTPNVDLIMTREGQNVLACPSVSGGKLWQAGAYSPQTKAYYVPLADACNTVAAATQEFTPGNAVASTRFGPRVLAEGSKGVGVIDAVLVNGSDKMWRYQQRATITSSLLATAGGLVFGGDAGRYVWAVDAQTGKQLWQARLNAPVGGYPMTYEINGVQYLAVPTGFSAQASSAAGMAPEIGVPSGSGNSVFVFRSPRT